jgi:hypothetical protein
MIVLLDYTVKKEAFSIESLSGVTDIHAHMSQDHGRSGNAQHAENDFRSKNCMNNELVFKGHPVRNDMVSHVFPEIQFSDRACNPCDTTCNYDIIEQENQSHDSIGPVSTLM